MQVFVASRSVCGAYTMHANSSSKHVTATHIGVPRASGTANARPNRARGKREARLTSSFLWDGTTRACTSIASAAALGQPESELRKFHAAHSCKRPGTPTTRRHATAHRAAPYCQVKRQASAASQHVQQSSVAAGHQHTPHAGPRREAPTPHSPANAAFMTTTKILRSSAILCAASRSDSEASHPARHATDAPRPAQMRWCAAFLDRRPAILRPLRTEVRHPATELDLHTIG
jgi:hypothetical protein